jgi:G3E family GTPase
VVIERPLSADRLCEALRLLPRDIYRLKGIFHVDVAGERRLLVQVVGDKVSTASIPTRVERPRNSEVVAVGLEGRVSGECLHRLFEACAAEVERSGAAAPLIDRGGVHCV